MPNGQSRIKLRSRYTAGAGKASERLCQAARARARRRLGKRSDERARERAADEARAEERAREPDAEARGESRTQARRRTHARASARGARAHVAGARARNDARAAVVLLGAKSALGDEPLPRCPAALCAAAARAMLVAVSGAHDAALVVAHHPPQPTRPG